MRDEDIKEIARLTASELSGLLVCPHKITNEQAANLIEVASWYKKFKNYAIITIAIIFVFGSGVSYTIIEKVNKIAKLVKLDDRK